MQYHKMQYTIVLKYIVAIKCNMIIVILIMCASSVECSYSSPVPCHNPTEAYV